MTTIQPNQLKRIHTLRRQAGLDEGDYRALLARVSGKHSAKDLTATEADAVLRHLGASPVTTGPARKADGPYAPILRALWFDAYQLGLVRSPADAALIGWVQRQTGVSHTRFLTEPEEARPAIEGLKKWIARAGGVEWPAGKGDILGAKRAIVVAQFERLVAIGAWQAMDSRPRPDLSDLEHYAHARGLGPNALRYYEERHFDRLMNKLGIWLRGALKAQEGAAS